MTQTSHTRVSDSPSIDTVADLLADRRRRHAVAVLANRESAMALRSLARAIASQWPDDDPPSTEALATSLHHVHLPKLAAAGAVAYDAEAKVVVPEAVDALADCLNRARNEHGEQSDAAAAN